MAIHCEPDVLLVDEVLAVGDVGFRAKCYNKIAELLRDCAVVIVSHNMPAIARVSSKCMVLNNGHSIFQGTTENAIQHYYSFFDKRETNFHSNGVMLVNSVIKGKVKNDHYILQKNGSLEMELELDAETEFKNISVILSILTLSGEYVAEWNSWVNGDHLNLRKGHQRFQVSLAPLRFNPGTYNMSLVITSENRLDPLLWIHQGWSFCIIGKRIGNAPYQINGSISSSEHKERIL